MQIRQLSGTQGGTRHFADMARFYFDTDDGTATDTDDEGVEFPDRDSARNAAKAILAVMVGERIPSESVGLRVTVRDESGQPIYFATLKLEGIDAESAPFS